MFDLDALEARWTMPLEGTAPLSWDEAKALVAELRQARETIELHEGGLGAAEGQALLADPASGRGLPLLAAFEQICQKRADLEARAPNGGDLRREFWQEMVRLGLSNAYRARLREQHADVSEATLRLAAGGLALVEGLLTEPAEATS